MTVRFCIGKMTRKFSGKRWKMELEITFCENQAIIYNYSKQKKLSFGNDLATQSNAKALNEK